MQVYYMSKNVIFFLKNFSVYHLSSGAGCDVEFLLYSIEIFELAQLPCTDEGWAAGVIKP